MEEGAANANTEPSTTSTESAAGGADPAPIPYPAFKKVNDEVKALRDEVAAYGKSKVEALQQTLQTKEAGFNTRLALAFAGVRSADAVEFLAEQYTKLPAEGRPPVADFVTQLRTKEPAFFGTSSVTGASSTTNTPTTPSPKTNPDANTNSPPAAQTDPPITDEYVKSVSTEDYIRRRPEIMAHLAKKARR